MGSLSFPFMRHKLGKNITGMIGFSLEAFCLILCVVSVFIVGSPFRPSELFQHYLFTSSPESSYATHPTFTVQELWAKERHVIVLLLGIILARFGLWIADLSVTQIFQEEVEESQRGVINGVQDSLNKLMDLVKFALVIFLPSPDTFGYLIFLSWFFVFLG
jgi:iron-regulated transporter 1